MAEGTEEQSKTENSWDLGFVAQVMKRIDDRSFFQDWLGHVLKASAAIFGGLLVLVGLLSALGILTHERLTGAEGMGGFTAWLMMVGAFVYGIKLVWNRADQIKAGQSETITQMGIHCLKIYVEIFSLVVLTAIAGFAMCLIIAGAGAQNTFLVMLDQGASEGASPLLDLAELNNSDAFPRVVGLIGLPVAFVVGFTALFILYFVIDVLKALYTRPMVAAIVFGVLLFGYRTLGGPH